MAGPFLELNIPEKPENLEKEDAEKHLRKALSVVTYRDKMTLNSWTIGHVGKDSPSEIVCHKESLPTEWGFAQMIVGYE